MRLIAVALALAAASQAVAQPAPAPAPAGAATPALGERMAPLAWLVGEWRGEGWMMTPDGSRHRFQSREAVTRRLSGNALLVEGQHHEPGQEPGRPGRLVHDAIGMITWDARTNAYRFRTALANGQGGDFPIEVSPTGFAWRIDAPGGRIDYVTTYANGVWTERGTRTGADGRAMPFFEMVLRRDH